LIPADVWYIMPYERMVRKNGEACCSIHFKLGGKREAKRQYGDCLEAWWRLRGEWAVGRAGGAAKYPE
jgi:hypothetical protein